MCHCLFHLLVLAVIAAASLVFIVAIKEKALFMTTQAYRASILHFPKKGLWLRVTTKLNLLASIKTI
jgi:hypothetical protein